MAEEHICEIVGQTALVRATTFSATNRDDWSSVEIKLCPDGNVLVLHKSKDEKSVCVILKWSDFYSQITDIVKSAIDEKRSVYVQR